MDYYNQSTSYSANPVTTSGTNEVKTDYKVHDASATNSFVYNYHETPGVSFTPFNHPPPNIPGYYTNNVNPYYSQSASSTNPQIPQYGPLPPAPNQPVLLPDLTKPPPNFTSVNYNTSMIPYIPNTSTNYYAYTPTPTAVLPSQNSKIDDNKTKLPIRNESRKYESLRKDDSYKSSKDRSPSSDKYHRSSSNYPYRRDRSRSKEGSR